MKIEEWSNVIVSWANFLDLEEKTTCLDDLCELDIFEKLLLVSQKNLCLNDGLYSFLLNEYPSLKLGECDSASREDIVLRVTAFLIYCSLHGEENEIRNKMRDLPEWIQLSLADFFKEIVDVPKNELVRDIIFSEISKIASPSFPPAESLTPKFGSPLVYSSSPSTAGDSQKRSSSTKKSKVQKLRDEISMLNLVKTDLSEELETAKESLATLEVTVSQKDDEIRALRKELLNFQDHVCDKSLEMAKIQDLEHTLKTLEKDRIKLEKDKSTLEEELFNVREESDSSHHQLQKLSGILQESQSLNKALEDEQLQLMKKIDQMESEINGLMDKCQSQSDYIAELSQSKDCNTSKLSEDGSLVLPESMEGVIDLRLHELETQLEKKDKEIQDSQDSIQSLQVKLAGLEKECESLRETLNTKEKAFTAEIESKDVTIKNYFDDLRNFECQNIFLSSTLREKESLVVSMQSSIDSLNDTVTNLRNSENALRREIQENNFHAHQLHKKVEALTIVSNENSREKDMLMKSMVEKERAIEEAYLNLDQVKLEFDSLVKSLQCELESKTEEARLLTSQLNEVTSSRDSLSGELMDAVNLNHQLESDLLQSRETNHQLYKENDDLKMSCSQFEKLLEQAQLENLVIQNQLEDGQKEISSLRDTVSELQQKNNVSDIALKEKDEYILSLNHMIEEKSREIQESLTKLKSLEKEYILEKTSLSNNLENCMSQKDSLQSENLKLKSEIKEISGQLRSLELELVSCKEKIKNSDSVISELKDKESILKDSLLKFREEDESLKTEIQILHNSVSSVTDELKSLQTNYDKVVEERDKLQKDFFAQNEESDRLRSRLDAVEAELTALVAEKNFLLSEIGSKDETISSLKEEVQLLHCMLVDTEGQSKELLKEIVMKNEVISDLEKILKDEKASDKIEALKAELSSKEAEIAELTRDKNSCSRELEEQVKKIESLTLKLESEEKEAVEIRLRLSQAEEEVSKLKLNCSDQDQTLKSLYATLHSQNSELRDKISELCQIKELLKEKEASIARASSEAERRTEKLYSQAELDAKIREVKTCYEKKVESYKADVKKRFNERLDDLTESLHNDNTDLKEKLAKAEERCNQLQGELWRASDQLLISQERNRTLLTKLQARNFYEVPRPSETWSPMGKARSMEVLSGRNRGIDNFARDVSPSEGSPTSSRRSSVRGLPRGLGKKFSFSTGKVFPAAEEDGEVFDNRYLADLKAGVCALPPTQDDRMSTLQYRNSLCPPHLKSSYPAEMQFFNVKEDEIKKGLSPNPSNGDESRKTKLQSSYKKPGPPTPSKKVGQSSLQTNARGEPIGGRTNRGMNETFTLHEANPTPVSSHRPPKLVTTPSRIRSLFFSSNKQKENTPPSKSGHRRN